MSEELFTKLRYCFQGGYTLPQFCVDKGINRPLFVLEKKYVLFFKEIVAQFRYDKRIPAFFCFIDGTVEGDQIELEERILGSSITVRSISYEKYLTYADTIIFLTKKEYDFKERKVIRFEELETFCRWRTYVDIPLLHFLQRYPKVRMILTNFPNRLGRYKGGVPFSKTLIDSQVLLRNLKTNKSGNEIVTPFDRFGYTNSQVIELLEGEKSRKNLDGTSTLIDTNKTSLQRIQDGRRLTADQPEHFRNTIYFFGPCYYFGRHAPYDKTIESYLQRMLNEKKLPYRVENEGQAFSERTQDMFYNLNQINPKPGDIIFLCVWHMHANNDAIPFLDLLDAFDPPHDFREVFCTTGHVNELGYKIIAEKYFDYLTKNNFFVDKEFKYPAPPKPYFHRYGIPPQYEQGGNITDFENEELEAYKQKLRAKRAPIGAIVMNCNPFTLGHRYLVEYAAERVLKLYVFVVEEDKSEFPFADRIELVKQGVKDLPNVEVLPSGKFIISQQTFSGYFSKVDLQDVVVDSSEDVEIFGRHAPIQRDDERNSSALRRRVPRNSAQDFRRRSYKRKLRPCRPKARRLQYSKRSRP